MDSTKVFVNCPFDNDFFPLLKCILFTLIYLELQPQISETTDSGEARLFKIKDLMMSSRYSIHDLSRVKPLKPRGLPRFNMPFECGIDFGLKLCGKDNLHEKRFLILEAKRYDYQKFMSDIAGNDIGVHANNPEQAIKVVRDWLKKNLTTIVPYHKEIWLAYNVFEYHYENTLKNDGYNPKDINTMTFSDIIDFMNEWIPKHKVAKATA